MYKLERNRVNVSLALAGEDDDNDNDDGAKSLEVKDVAALCTYHIASV